MGIHYASRWKPGRVRSPGNNTSSISVLYKEIFGKRKKLYRYIDIKAACLYTFLFVVRIFTGVVKDGSQNVCILI